MDLDNFSAILQDDYSRDGWYLVTSQWLNISHHPSEYGQNKSKKYIYNLENQTVSTFKPS